MQELIAFLNQIHPLPERDRQMLLEHLQSVSFQRKEIITGAGETERYLYLVEEGVQRSYYIQNGKEIVIAFTYPPSYSGIPESFISQEPSAYYLEAITASKMWRLSYSSLQELMDHSPAIERLYRKSLEGVLIGLTQRQYELLALDMEARFRTFLKRSPHLLNLVPHKHLASYLGMDPTNFSRLLGRIKI